MVRECLLFQLQATKHKKRNVELTKLLMNTLYVLAVMVFVSGGVETLCAV